MVTAALYYVRPVAEEGGEATMVDDGVEMRKAASDRCHGRAVTEEGGERRMSRTTQRQTGRNGGTSDGDTKTQKTRNPPNRAEVDAATTEVSVAQVRAVRRSEEGDEAATGINAQRRARTANSAGDEVDAAIATLDAAQLDRRRRQSEVARASLAQRRQRYRGMQVYSMDERARARLVQRTQEPAAGATLDPDVEADVLAEDGLPTATMMVEGERLPVKLDSGARYSVRV
ncbi:hypothetical protein PInf_028060 [Phytophthora infestans]|nr:hypothetical protein PInf_028060 [Phytophthora infestans]